MWFVISDCFIMCVGALTCPLATTSNPCTTDFKLHRVLLMLSNVSMRYPQCQDWISMLVRYFWSASIKRGPRREEWCIRVMGDKPGPIA